MSRIDEIRERVSKATEGPWLRDEYNSPDMQIIAHGNEVILYHHKHNRQVSAQVVDNHNFIAHAREDIPYLLAALAEKDARIAYLAEHLEMVESSNGENARSVFKLSAALTSAQERIGELEEAVSTFEAHRIYSKVFDEYIKSHPILSEALAALKEKESEG